MSDDLSQRWACRQLPNGMMPIIVCERVDLLAEIKRLRAARSECERQYQEILAKFIERDVEVERLRAHGDALAMNYEIMLEPRWSAFGQAFLTAWQEARRG